MTAAPTTDIATLRAIAATAVDALGSRPLVPTGALSDALASGRLVATRDISATARILADGILDAGPGRAVGAGMHGMLFRSDVHLGDQSVSTVIKHARQGATAERLGARLASTIGLDDIIPVTAGRTNGDALIEFRPGHGPQFSTRDANWLDVALTTRHLASPTNRLTVVEAATAGRIERQVLGATDYVLTNPDRNASNILVDQTGSAATGSVAAIDWGLAGRGQLAVAGGTELRPALGAYQGPAGAQHVDLDPVVVKLIRQRLTPTGLAELHASTIETALDRTSSVGSAKFLDGMQQRLQQVLTGRYEFHPYVPGSAGGAGPAPPEATRGWRATRGGSDWL